MCKTGASFGNNIVGDMFCESFIKLSTRSLFLFAFLYKNPVFFTEIYSNLSNLHTNTDIWREYALYQCRFSLRRRVWVMSEEFGWSRQVHLNWRIYAQTDIKTDNQAFSCSVFPQAADLPIIHRFRQSTSRILLIPYIST